MAVLLKSFAGVGVTHRHHEEAEAEGQHDDIQHEVLLVALVFRSRPLRVAGKAGCDGSNRIEDATRALPVSVTVRCHSPHRFSRRGPRPTFKKLPKNRNSHNPRTPPPIRPYFRTQPP